MRRVKWTLLGSLPPQLQQFVPFPQPDLLLNKVPIALSLLGTEALPNLISATRDPNADVQWVTVRAIGLIGPPAKSALPVLIQLVGQTNNVCGLAAWAVGQMGPTRTQAIPALIAALPVTRSDATRTLGNMGPDAAAAVPALTTLLDSPNEVTRLRAATALWQITQNTNLLERIMGELGKRQGYVTYKGYLNLLGEMGPSAKPAIPIIFQTMTNWGTDLSHTLRPVVLRIDPEAISMLTQPAR